jgi:hypothetical protein
MPCAPLFTVPPQAEWQSPRHIYLGPFIVLAFTRSCFPYRINASSGLSRGTPMMNSLHGSDADNSLDDALAHTYIIHQYQTIDWFGAGQARAARRTPRRASGYPRAAHLACARGPENP